MWKILKALPKTWRHKACSPLGSNPCPDESAESESGTNGGAPDLLVCNTASNEEASALSINDRKCDNSVSDEESAKSPTRCLYVWWFNKTLHRQPTHYECPVRSFIEAFCVGVTSLLEKKRELSASCGKLVDRHIKENHLRLSISLAQIAFTKHGFNVSHSVLPSHHADVSVSSTASLSDTAQASNTGLPSDKSESALPFSTCQQSENDEILSQLEEIAAEYTSHILNNDAKRLVKQKHYGQALAMFNSASELGLAEAKYNMGVCYESGLGMAPDINKALRYFNEAAKLDHSGALYNLAVFHLEGKGVPVNETRGIEYMEKASEGGIKEAHTFLGVHCGQHGEYKKAVQLFQKAADQKDPDGEYYLGLCYEHGVGVEEDVQSAIDLYKKASAAGNAEACYILGTYYDEGLRGVQKDKSSALELYQKAASNGHLLAIERLKWSSQEVEEVEEDDFIVFEDDDISSSSLNKTPESTLRTTKSSPELTSQLYDATSSNHTTELPNDPPQFDLSLLKKFIEQWSNGIGVPVKHRNDNKDQSSSFEKYNGLSQSLTKLSLVDKTPQFWDTKTPKSSLVSLR